VDNEICKANLKLKVLRSKVKKDRTLWNL